jgi:hypothetical protein
MNEENLITLRDIAAMYGKNFESFRRCAQRLKNFPKPVGKRNCTHLYDPKDFENYKMPKNNMREEVPIRRRFRGMKPERQLALNFLAGRYDPEFKRVKHLAKIAQAKIFKPETVRISINQEWYENKI